MPLDDILRVGVVLADIVSIETTSQKTEQEYYNIDIPDIASPVEVSKIPTEPTRCSTPNKMTKGHVF